MKVNKNTGDVFWAKKYAGGGDWYPMFNKSNGAYYMDHPVLPGDATITKMDLSGNPIKTFDIHAYTQGSGFRYFPTADNGVILPLPCLFSEPCAHAGHGCRRLTTLLSNKFLAVP